MENIQFVPARARQIRFLEARGFRHVVDWSFEEAKNMIDRIADNGWRVPAGIIPEEYEPKGAEARGRKWTDHPMFDLHPSYVEVQAAKAVFLSMLRKYQKFTRLPAGSAGYMSPEVAAACALAEVWRQGRKYQRDQDGAALLELAGLVPATTEATT